MKSYTLNRIYIQIEHARRFILMKKDTAGSRIDITLNITHKNVPKILDPLFRTNNKNKNTKLQYIQNYIY